MLSVIDLLIDLVKKPSISPNDCGCQQLIANLLQSSGFNIYPVNIDDTCNLVAMHGDGHPSIMLVGHTDVVPAGELALWQYPPFSATINNGYLYGRGSADMKSAVASMVVALIDFVKNHPNHLGKIGLILTSDEESSGKNGMKRVIEYLNQQKIKIDYAIIGEPTASNKLGDFAKIGRRGSLNLTIKTKGKQGHVAYSDQTSNPIHSLNQIIYHLNKINIDQTDDYFPPTSMQVSNIKSGFGVFNLIPNTAEAMINWRFNLQTSADEIKKNVNNLIDQLHLTNKVELNWQHTANPFLCTDQYLLNQIKKASDETTGQNLQFNTDGGTSDARFFAQNNCKTIEIGVCNQTIHQANERVLIDEVLKLTIIYQKILQNMLTMLNFS